MYSLIFLDEIKISPQMKKALRLCGGHVRLVWVKRKNRRVLSLQRVGGRKKCKW